MRCSVPIQRSPVGNDGYRLPTGPGVESLDRDARDPDAEIRFYYIDSVKWIETGNGWSGQYQFGSGLNLQTRIATLCTCKHGILRVVNKSILKNGHRPIYIAVLGDTQGRKDARNTPLVFLGKVARSFDSFEGVWKFLPAHIRGMKDVRQNPLGDLYSPALLQTFKRFGRIETKRFSPGFSHRNRKDYSKDIRQSKPIIFREWRAWPDADMFFNNKRLKGFSLPDHFRAMIRKPKPAAYGWKFRLSELKSILGLLDK